MLLADGRVELDPRPVPAALPVLEVAMLGHCRGAARWDRVAGDPALLDEIAALGLARAVRRLLELAAGAAPLPGDADLRELYRLPLPVNSLGHFQALFPDAFRTDTREGYRSTLGGDRAWLPLAVQDFFDGPPVAGAPRKLWVIRVPEKDGADALLPTPGADLALADTLGAFEQALSLPRVGLLALPDLERLLVPPRLPDIPRLRLPNPDPVFLPCGTQVDDGHRERRNPDEMPPEFPRPAPESVLGPIARTLARWRPDLLCLLTLPLDPEPRGERPTPAPAFLDQVRAAAARALADTDDQAGAGALRQVQLLYPYLRGPGGLIHAPSGLVAGAQARVAQEQGPWRSIADRPLPGLALPWPPLTQQAARALREDPGVTVLLNRDSRPVVDDERLAAPCLAAPELRRLPAARRADEHWRSAEVMRFMAWLTRELRQLGERLVFDVDPRDPRPELALRAFFTRLHAQGALRGAKPEDAFRLERRKEGEAKLVFEIELAPAYPVDVIRVTFLHDRAAGGVSASVEAAGG